MNDAAELMGTLFEEVGRSGAGFGGDWFVLGVLVGFGSGLGEGEGSRCWKLGSGHNNDDVISTLCNPPRTPPTPPKVGEAELQVCRRTRSPHVGTCGPLVDGVFGALVSEAVRCGACGRQTHTVVGRVEHTHTYTVAALRFVGAEGGLGLGRLLRAVGEQDMKKCDRDKGGCDAWQVRACGSGGGGGGGGVGRKGGFELLDLLVLCLKPNHASHPTTQPNPNRTHPTQTAPHPNRTPHRPSPAPSSAAPASSPCSWPGTRTRPPPTSAARWR